MNKNTFEISPGKAFDIYSEKYPNTTIIELELEAKAGSHLYKVKGFDQDKEYKIYINADSGDIIEVSEKIAQGRFTHLMRSHADLIQALVDKTLKETGVGSNLVEWSLEVEDGILELSLEIDLENNEDVKYKYNLLTGALLKKK